MDQKSSLEQSPLAHVVDRLREVEVVPDPYPHYYLENVFPEGYYQELLSHLPASSVYENLYEVTDLKLDQFRHRDQRDLTEGWTETLPDEVKSFWEDFDKWFLGPELAAAVLDSFAEPLKANAGLGNSRPSVSVESQLIRHRAGYFLGPHSDLHTKLVVLLMYLAPDDSAGHLGTSIYRPKDPDFTCRNSRHYPFEDFVRVKTAPYKRNSMLGFVRSDISFHGVEPLREQDVNACSRDLIQYVLYKREAREAQLRERQLAALKGANA